MTLVLHHVQRHLEGFHTRSGRREPSRKTSHIPRQGHVPLQVRGRDREGVGEIVETSIRRLVTRQKRPDVHVEHQQLVDSVVVLQAVEPMDRIGRARVGLGPRNRPVDFRLQPPRHEVVLGWIGPCHATRWHGAGPQLPDYRLPTISGRNGVLDVQHVERQSTVETPLVVTPYAVRVENLPDLLGVRPSGVE